MLTHQEKKRLSVRAAILKALAHPSRLRMVEELAEGEQCVCDLQQIIGADISTISKHLAILKNVGIVDNQKRGLQVFYRLNYPCVLKFFDCLEEVISEHSTSK